MSITKYLAASYWAESHFKTHHPDAAPYLKYMIHHLEALNGLLLPKYISPKHNL